MVLRRLLKKTKRNQPSVDDVLRVDWLVVGLGNPGARYANTRHNIGRMVADCLTSSLSRQQTLTGRTFSSTAGTAGSSSIAIVEPTLYMNESGRAVAEAQRLFSVSTENIIVLVDEYNFPVGKVHAKRGGGNGGHNGTASVIDELQSKEFIRFRCGIDRDFGPGELVDYVLSPFSHEQEDGVSTMIEQSVQAIHHLLRTPFATACSDINSGQLFKNLVDNSNESSKL